MKNEINYFVFVLFSLLFITSCSGQKTAEIHIDKEIQSETTLQPSEVAKNSREYILKSRTLSEVQKNNLIALQDKTSSESQKIKEEINKAKMVYIKTILDPKVNEREVFVLRKRIKRLSKKSIDLDAKLFTEARKIIDPLREARDREYLYNSFMMRQNANFNW